MRANGCKGHRLLSVSTSKCELQRLLMELPASLPPVFSIGSEAAAGGAPAVFAGRRILPEAEASYHEPEEEGGLQDRCSHWAALAFKTWSSKGMQSHADWGRGRARSRGARCSWRRNF